MSSFGQMNLMTQTGPGQIDAPPSSGDAMYAHWVEQHQLDAAALLRRRDRRRLSRALRQAKRLRRRNEAAWDRVRQAERRVDAAPAQ